MKIKTIIQLDDGSLVTIEASVEKTLKIVKMFDDAETAVYQGPDCKGTFNPQSQNIVEIAKEEVRAILDRGQKISAIKRYRELTGVGLKESKDLVESMISEEYPNFPWKVGGYGGTP